MVMPVVSAAILAALCTKAYARRIAADPAFQLSQLGTATAATSAASTAASTSAAAAAASSASRGPAQATAAGTKAGKRKAEAAAVGGGARG
eukprot:scaffold131525_cov36-Phaeocystis_antarctica.AAC.1